MANGQSLTQFDEVVAQLWFEQSFDAEFLREALHPEVKIISKHCLCNGVDEVTEQFAQWYKPRPPVDKYQPSPREFLKVITPRFVDGQVSAPALTELGYRMHEHCAHGMTGVQVKPLDENKPDSPARIAGYFYSHYSDHYSGGITFASETCIPSKMARSTTKHSTPTPR